MAKQTIRVGDTANDRKGDSLRSAFQKVNANFTELYVALGLDSGGLNLGAFEFTGSTISTTDSSSILIDQATVISSNLTIGGDLTPVAPMGGNIGSPTHPWHSLYVSNSTVYLGGTPLSLDPNTNELKINNVPISQNITYTDIPNAPSDIADLTDNTGLLGGGGGGSTLVNGSKTVSLDSTGSLTIPGDIRSEGNINIDINLSDSTLRRWQFGEDGILTLPGGKVSMLASTSYGSIQGSVNTPIIVYSGGSTGQASLQWTNANPENNVAATAFSGVIVGSGIDGAGDVAIITGAYNPMNGDFDKEWSFKSNGSLTFPDSTVQTTAALTYTNFGDSGVRTDGGTGNNFWKPTIVDGTGTINKAGVYKTADNSNNSLFTFGANGAGVMSVLMDGSLFVGSTLPSNNGGLNTNFGGWLVVQAGGKFGGDLDTLGRVYLNGNQFEDDSGVLDFFSVSAGNHIVTCHSDWTLKLKARANSANQGNLWLEAGQNTKIKVKGNGSNIDIIASDGSSTATWNFAKTGTLTVPANGIITAPIAQEFQLQAKDTDSVLRNEINLDPNNGTYMSVWSDQTTSFSFNDWGTGSWNNESGLGAARFTDAQALQDFWTTGIGSLGLAYEVSINGGPRTPNVFYDGNNGEQYGVTLGLDAVPPGGQGTTVPITSLVFYYRTQSKINMDVDGGEILLDAQAMDLDLRTTENLDLRSSKNLNLRGLGAYPVRIYTNGTTHMWEFDTSGSLTLPREGKIYGIGQGAASDRAGYISWDGNSSGDGQGYNTMRLVPDLQGLEAADQYIILDPTSPGHIHIRAGGTQDNSQADLYLGGENSHVKISAGVNPPVTVKANSNSWIFGTDGRTTFPNGTVPAHSYGAAGDKEGMVVFDDTYIYYCTADYVNNSTDIWKRTAHGAGTW